MTQNDIVVCQEALSLLRQETELSQTTHTTPTTKAEKACNRTFDYARRAFLAAHDWNFARARTAYSSAKPTCLRVLDVTDAAGVTVRWRLDGDVLSAPNDAAYTVYTQDLEPVVEWPPLARAAFVAYLARELCVPITGRLEDLKALDALVSQRTAEARLANLREGSPADDREEEVMAMLRQASVLSGNVDADGAEAALRRLPSLIKSAAEEVYASHVWGVNAGYDNLPPLAKSAALALAAHKVAVRCGAAAESSKALYGLYEEKLRKARAKHLSDAVSNTSDALQREILARLLGEFSDEEKALGFNLSAYTARIGSVKATVLGALNDAHSWGETYTEANLAGTLKEAFVLGVCAALAGTVGVPAERAVAYRREYEEALRKARAKRLNEQLAASNDGVLAELVANFKTDDAGLVHAFDVYTTRIASVRSGAESEVEASHDWPEFDDEGKNSGLASLKAVAVNTRILEKLSTAVGGGENAARRYANEYGEKLLAARVYALENEQPSSSVAAEVAAVLRPMLGVKGFVLPRSFSSRVAELLPAARQEVMGAHRWNFARERMPVGAPVGPDGETLVPRPVGCVRVEAVERPDGALAEWSMRGDFIVAKGPVRSVTYVRDVEEADEWPPSVRRALVYCIASKIALQGGDQTFAAIYTKTLSEAAALDAREGNPGRSAWGRGRFVQEFRGRGRFGG